MARRKKSKRKYKMISFKVYYDTDEHILDWWEGIEDGDRSEALRDLIRDGLNGYSDGYYPARRRVSVSELIRVRDDTSWIRDALDDMPAYLEQLVQTVAAMQPALAAVGAADYQAGPSISTQDRNEREVNMKERKW